MSITEATEIFKKLLKETSNKRELKIYKGFITILTNLESRDLTEKQLLLVEDEIKILNLKSNPENKRRYFSKKLNIFKEFLKDEFSLITEGYYTSLGMVLGMCLGVAVGGSLGISSTSTGLALGMLIGMLIGRSKDEEAIKQNRVLKNRISSL